jgi:hypothetical protein
MDLQEAKESNTRFDAYIADIRKSLAAKVAKSNFWITAED